MTDFRLLAGAAAIAGALSLGVIGAAAAQDAQVAQDGGALDCAPIIEAIQLGEDAIEVVTNAVGEGGDPGAVGSCALEAGAEIDDILAGLDAAGVEPDVVAQLADELEAAAGALPDAGGAGGPTDITNPPLSEGQIVREVLELAGES